MLCVSQYEWRSNSNITLQITCQERGKHDAATKTHGCEERKKRKRVSATTAVKDKRAGKPVKTREAATTPAAEKGGQPTVLYVDVVVDIVAKNGTCEEAKDCCSHSGCGQH